MSTRCVESSAVSINTLRTTRERIAGFIARQAIAVVVCDNTLLGPVFQKPLQHGTDIVVYSLTNMSAGTAISSGAALGSQPAYALWSSCGAARSEPSSDPQFGLVIAALARTLRYAYRRVARQRRSSPSSPEQRAASPSYLSPPTKRTGRPRLRQQCGAAGATFSSTSRRRARKRSSSSRARNLKLAVSLAAPTRMLSPGDDGPFRRAEGDARVSAYRMLDSVSMASDADDLAPT